MTRAALLVVFAFASFALLGFAWETGQWLAKTTITDTEEDRRWGRYQSCMGKYLSESSGEFARLVEDNCIHWLRDYRLEFEEEQAAAKAR